VALRAKFAYQRKPSAQKQGRISAKFARVAAQNLHVPDEFSRGLQNPISANFELPAQILSWKLGFLH
jgi:hypothetical protein